MQNIFLLLFLRRGGGGSAKMPTILHPGGVVAFCYPMTSHLSISSPVVGGCAAQEGGVRPTWCRKSHTLKYELRRVLDRKEEVDDEVVVAVASSVSSHGWRRRPSLRPSYLINYLLGSAHFLGTPITLLRRSYWLYGRPPASVEDGRPCRHTDRALTSQPQRPDWRKKKKESRIRNKKQKKIQASVQFHFTTKIPRWVQGAPLTPATRQYRVSIEKAWRRQSRRMTNDTVFPVWKGGSPATSPAPTGLRPSLCAADNDRLIESTAQPRPCRRPGQMLGRPPTVNSLMSGFIESLHYCVRRAARSRLGPHGELTFPTARNNLSGCISGTYSLFNLMHYLLK